LTNPAYLLLVKQASLIDLQYQGNTCVLHFNDGLYIPFYVVIALELSNNESLAVSCCSARLPDSHKCDFASYGFALRLGVAQVFACRGMFRKWHPSCFLQLTLVSVDFICASFYVIMQ